MSQQPGDFPTQPQGSVAPPPPPPTRNGTAGGGGGGINPLYLGLGAALLLAVIVGGYFVFSSGGKQPATPTPVAGRSTTTNTIGASGTTAATTVAIAPTNTQGQDPTATNPPPVGAPKVLGISPAPLGELVRPRQAIAVTFSQAMDRLSAQSALLIEPAVEGDYSWETGIGGVETLLFTPRGAGFARDTNYKVSIGQGATNIVAAAVENNDGVVREFRTVGLPQVLRGSPAEGATNIPPDASITIQFNLQMIPLTTLDNQQDASGKVRIEPAVEGRFVWLGTSTLAFQPTQPLRGGTTYRVTVSRDLTDIDGGQLAQEYSFSFKTANPRVVYTYPRSEYDADNDSSYYPSTISDYSGSVSGPGSSYYGDVTAAAPVIAVFSQPMDHDSTQQAFSIQPAVAGNFSWGAGLSGAEVMTYTPSVSFTLNTTYTVSIANSAKPAGGDGNLLEAARWEFHTFGPLQVEGLDVSLNSIRLDFSNPVRQNTLKGKFRISPELTFSTTNLFGDGDYGTDYLTINARLDPSTRYTITLDGEIFDIAGQRLQTPFTASESTPASPPTVSILGASEKASFNAGQPTNLYLGSINVRTLNFNLYQLDQNQLATRTIQYSAELDPSGLRSARSWSLNVEAELDKGKVTRLPLALTANAAKLDPGFYLFTVEAPADSALVPVPEDNSGDPQPIRDRMLLVVGNNALTLKTATGQALVWAVDQNTGRPTAGLPIAIYRPAADNDTQPRQVASGVTDASGLYQVDNPEFAQYAQMIAISSGGPDAAAVSSYWNEGLTSSEFVLYRWDLGTSYPYRGSYGDYNAYLYSDRPLYRPNQDVFLKAVLRRDNDAVYTLPQNVNARVFVNDGSNDVYSQTVTISPQGTWDGKIKLGKDARLGTYTMRLEVQAAGDTRPNAAQSYFYYFSVQEYRKPEYEVSLVSDKTDYVNGDTIRSTVSAGYFFGGPVANSKGTARITSSDYFFSWSDPDSDDYYDFNDYDALYARRQASSSAQIADRSFITNNEGKATIETRADLSRVPVSQIYAINTSIMDSSNQEVTASDQVVVHKGAFYVGLRPSVYVAEANKPFSVTIQTVDVNSKKLGAQQVQLTLASRTYENTQEKDEEGQTQFVYKPTDTNLEQQSATTDGTGKASATFTVKAGGQYVVKALARDTQGNEIVSATYIYVGAPGDEYVSWKRDNTNRVELVNDKKIYNVGDTAKVLVTSPYTTATALLTTERGTIRTTRVLRLTNNSTVLDVPLDANSVPNVFVSLTIINSIADGGEAPSFKQGYVELRMDESVKTLNVSLKPDKAQYLPGDEATYTVKTTNAAGQPVAANLSLALVDKAIFSLASDTSGDMLTNFYGLRALSVGTSSSLAILRAQNTAYDRYAAPGAAADMAAGGGGAKGGGGGEGATTVRSNLQDTAFWTGNVATDGSGNASVKFKLPDNVTTWVMTAKGATDDTLVGQDQNEILVTKPLIVRPVLPRFLTVGDTVQPGVIVRNATASELTVDVSLQVTGTTFVGGNTTGSGDNSQQAQSQQVRVPANGEQKVNFTLKAGNGTAAGFTMVAKSANNGPSDALQTVIPIKPFISGEVTSDSGEISGEISRTVFIPYGVDASVGELKATINASLAGGALDAAEYTYNYPYDSTETTVSRFLPLLVVGDTFTEAKQPNPYDRVLSENMGVWIQRLYALQHRDGGWGMWEEDNYSTSYPFMTAYALEGLLSARSHNYTVDPTVIDRAVKYLRDTLNAQDGGGKDGDIYGANDLNVRAYILNILMLVERANGEEVAKAEVGRLNALNENAADKLNTFGRANLVIALVRSGQPDKAKAALAPLTAAAKLTSDTAHWEENRADRYYYLNMDSDDRSTAAAIRALLAATPEDPIITQAVRWLMQHRSEGSHWESTQASGQVIRALARYVAVKKELTADYNYTVNFNNKQVANGNFSTANLTDTTRLTIPVAEMLINESNAILFRRDKQEGAMYYGLSLSYYLPAQGIVARSNGLSVSRSYYPETASPTSRPISSTVAGDLVRVRLRVTVPQDSYYVTVEDPLPAGFEALNPDLLTTRPLNNSGGGCYGPVAEGDGNSDPTFCRSYDGSEIRDDRVAYFATYLSAGTYEFEYSMRATTPGTFFALPTRAYLQYAPDVFGRSDGGEFIVK